MKKVFGIFIVATILLACNEDKIYGDSSKLETEINIPSLIDSLYM